ncbi:hypothetical protein NA655_07665 [Pseudomonas kuykendallii]|uniref:Uncharacterized protein n=2 Tax=Pseudomonas TaxID=286 RepID=A0A1H3F111_9PSED|nr:MULTISPECIES: hypothetical protein [Pseudomonas]MCQ4270893.1 hypothetical protein [Pseudomonas kuykendallii]SDX83889.1 hypothetical protein SAMN05216287_3931 [Pseudomonas kuykendallii]
MSHLSSATRRAMRKDLVRLRMEMHRQQLLYHSQPLSHPLQQAKQFMSARSSASTNKTPLVIGAGIVLTLFGKRLGMLGKIARLGLAVYPLVKAFGSVEKKTVVVERPVVRP